MPALYSSGPRRPHFLRQGKVQEATLEVIVSIASAAQTPSREKWQPRLLTPVTWGINVLNALLNTVLILSKNDQRGNSS